MALVCAAAAAVAAGDRPPIVLYQDSWLNPDGTYAQINSDYAEIVLDLGQLGPFDFDADTDGILWVNATLKRDIDPGSGEWVLRDAPLIDLDDPPGEAALRSYLFALLSPGGGPWPPGSLYGPEVELVLSITPEPLRGPPFGPTSFLVMQNHDLYANAGLGEPISQPQPIVVEPAYTALIDTEPFPFPWAITVQLGAGGVAEQFNHCTPGATARALAWMNRHFCLGFPEDCTTETQIYDKLKDANHMMTTKQNGTYWWSRTGEDVNGKDATWGKMYAGLKKFLEEKGLLGIFSLKIEVDFFKKQGADPATTPCTLFDRLAAGKGTVVNIGWWRNDTTIDNSKRDGGHSITALGAIKCGETVWLVYRDDAHGGDMQNNKAQTGDNKKDKGYKFAKFVKGGASGWKLLGGRWEGFLSVCPQFLAIVRGIVMKLVDSLLPYVEEAQGYIEQGQIPPPPLLEKIQKLACQIYDLACQLEIEAGSLEPPCPELVEIAGRLKAKALALKLQAKQLRIFPSPGILDRMLQKINEMLLQLQQLDSMWNQWYYDLCTADLTGDGIVDGADVGIVISAWDSTDDSPADLNQDGIVDGADLGMVLRAWGPCPKG